MIWRPRPFSLMGRVHGDVDDFKVQRAVADDASHTNGHARIEDMHAVAATRQTRAGAFQRARRHT